MYSRFAVFFSNFLESGHEFEAEDILLKFQYRVINTILLVMAVFTFIFAILSSLGINPIGYIQTVVNYLLVISAVLIILNLRKQKENYITNAYLMYAVAYLDFLSALIFVPQDEFRMIWFYLLVFAAYITGGIRAGNIVSIVSVFTILAAEIFYDLQLSQTAVITSVLGLVIASLFFRAHTKKIMDFEKSIIAHEEHIIAQSRLAAMGEMMSMIAHQWRQPLSTMTLLITNERVKSIMLGKSNREQDKILDNISDTLVYLSDTIDDFQTYFKPGKETEVIQTSELLNRLQHFIEARAHIAEVEIHIDENCNESIETYVNELLQVMINIINNAVDILEERECERNIWISLDCDNENIIIDIEDSGGGISSEVFENIFEPYFSKKSKNGTGLGLYMAKMIVDKHINGTLNVANTSRGACFSIKLPKKINKD